jgi:hypothetical protein
VPVHVNLEKRLRKASITGAIGTKLRRKEFALRKDAMKLMKDGCCSSLHLVFIIQTPALLPAFTSIKKKRYNNTISKLIKIYLKKMVMLLYN